jgi:hypothetical protein
MKFYGLLSAQSRVSRRWFVEGGWRESERFVKWMRKKATRFSNKTREQIYFDFLLIGAHLKRPGSAFALILAFSTFRIACVW